MFAHAIGSRIDKIWTLWSRYGGSACIMAGQASLFQVPQRNHSAASSFWILKYLSWYVFFVVAMTLRNSFKSCFLRYFLVKYLRYLLESGIFDSHTIDSLSMVTVTELPRLFTLLSTLIWAYRNVSKSFRTITLSSIGSLQSMKYLSTCFFPLLPALPFAFATCFTILDYNLY